jgi:hypothetical protein
MSSHISEDLPRLLTGDATRDETLGAAQHLRGCPDCQQELISAVVAHASLTSAHRFAAAVIDPGSDEQGGEAVAPTPITQRYETSPSAAATRRDDAVRQPAHQREPLPDMSRVFATVRAEATQPPRSARPARRRWLTAAAAAAVLAGGGVTAAELVGAGSPSPTAAQTVTLRPAGDISASATATISGGTMHVDATTLPRLSAARQYEVWLVAAGGTRLRPLGYVAADRRATLPVPTPVMSRYDTIAISIQKTDQVAFSGDIVVHGRYA